MKTAEAQLEVAGDLAEAQLSRASIHVNCPAETE